MGKPGGKIALVAMAAPVKPTKARTFIELDHGAIPRKETGLDTGIKQSM